MVKSKDNGHFKAYHDKMLTTIQKALSPELRARAEAKEKFSELQGKWDLMEIEHQQAIATHERLLAELETADNPVEKAKELAHHQQQSAAIRQGKNFLTQRVQAAQEAVKKAQNRVDSRFKAEIVKLHAPFQAEVAEEAKALASRINQYERAIATVTNLNIGVGFLVMSKHSKKWLTLTVSALEDYV